MPNGRNEALCLTCLHVVAIADKRYCSLHKVILPIDSFGHWLICCNWQDENLPDSSNLTRWKQEYLQLSDKTMLYKYHIYTYGPAIPVAAFADLEKCE